MSPSRSTTRIRISLELGAGARRSPVGFIGALAIYVVVVAAALFTWEHHLDIAQESPPIVPVDLVTIAAKTNIAPAAPKIVPQQTPLPVQPVEPVVPQPVVPPEPVEPPPEQAPSEPLVKIPPPSIVTPKARPQVQPDKKKSFDINNVLALLNKVAPSPSQSANTKTAQQTRKGIGAQNAMTMDLVDALKNQIEQCWSSPAGAPHPEQLIVYVELSLNPDGSVARPPQLTVQSSAAVSGNPFMAAARDAAIRAIYVCGPYKLPVDRYADWRDSTIKFDPRDLAGQ